MSEGRLCFVYVGAFECAIFLPKNISKSFHSCTCDLSLFGLPAFAYFIMSMELADSFGKPGQSNENDDSAEVPLKSSSSGFTLIPQPSDDVKDPLVCHKIFQANLIYHATLISTHNSRIGLYQRSSIPYSSGVSDPSSLRLPALGMLLATSSKPKSTTSQTQSLYHTP